MAAPASTAQNGVIVVRRSPYHPEGCGFDPHSGQTFLLRENRNLKAYRQQTRGLLAQNCSHRNSSKRKNIFLSLTINIELHIELMNKQKEPLNAESSALFPCEKLFWNFTYTLHTGLPKIKFVIFSA